MILHTVLRSIGAAAIASRDFSAIHGLTSSYGLPHTINIALSWRS